MNDRMYNLHSTTWKKYLENGLERGFPPYEAERYAGEMSDGEGAVEEILAETPISELRKMPDQKLFEFLVELYVDGLNSTR